MSFTNRIINESYGFYFLDALTKNGELVENKTKFQKNFPYLFNHRPTDADGDKIFYYMEVKDGTALQFIDLDFYISQTILDRIRDLNNPLHLMLNNSHEAFDTVIEHLYAHVIKRQQIPAEKIIYINNSFDVAKRIDVVSKFYCLPPVKAEMVVDFEAAGRGSLNHTEETDITTIPETLVKENIKKVYLNFNRRWRPHRPPFVSLLAARDLLKDGYVSFGKSDFSQSMDEIYLGMLQTNSFFPEMYGILRDNEEIIKNIPEMYLDYTDLVTNRAALDLTPGYLYAESLISVVSETYYYTKFPQHETGRFLSEKTFKPIMFKHPFIILSVPNILSAVKQIGYQTFDGIINESYDTIHSDGERMMAVIREIERIRDLKEDQLDDFIGKCKEVTDYNQKVFLNKTQFCYRMNY